jgi:4-hydroxybenzoate polyprenyltransferase
MIADALRFIRFSHTVFALPFAAGSMLVAADGLPALRVIVLVLLAMVFARTAAMAFNRVADWEFDQRNPRTEGRHRLMTKPAAIALVTASSVAFVATTWFINALCFWLSPVALAIIFFYSLTKRFTHGTQFFLGLALSVSPMGAWFAVHGAWSWTPAWLAAGVLCWVAGFDLIYATQDYEFDRKEGLRSMVVKLGIPGSLHLAKVLHVAALAFFCVFGWLAGLHFIYGVAMALVAGALVVEHRSAARLDVAGINRAFFAVNAWVGAIFVAGVALDISIY